MEQQEYRELGKRFDTREARAEFIRNAESDLYIGRTEDGREARVFLQKGVGMKVQMKQRGKPNWWEVIMYDADGYQEGITYEPRDSETEGQTVREEEESGTIMMRPN